MSVPSTSTWPFCGGFNPSIVRSSTDFPEPEPPTKPSVSCSLSERLTPSCTVCVPNRLVTSLSSISAVISNPRLLKDDGKEGVGHDDDEDGLDHGQRGSFADAFCGAGNVEALIAADDGNGESEHRRLDHADEKHVGRRNVLHADEILMERDVEKRQRHQTAADEANEIGKKGQQGQR